MYSGDYAGRRFSALDQINVSNAATLVPKWAYQTMASGKFETTPLVVDGILYGTGQDDRQRLSLLVGERLRKLENAGPRTDTSVVIHIRSAPHDRYLPAR